MHPKNPKFHHEETGSIWMYIPVKCCTENETSQQTCGRITTNKQQTWMYTRKKKTHKAISIQVLGSPNKRMLTRNIYTTAMNQHVAGECVEINQCIDPFFCHSHPSHRCKSNIWLIAIGRWVSQYGKWMSSGAIYARKLNQYDMGNSRLRLHPMSFLPHVHGWFNRKIPN